MKKNAFVILYMMIAFLVAGCGGGSGDKVETNGAVSTVETPATGVIVETPGTGGTPLPPIIQQPPIQSTKAIITIALSQSPPAGSIPKTQQLAAGPVAYGFSVSMDIPMGVSVDLSPGASAVIPSGDPSWTTYDASYTPQPSGAGRLTLLLISREAGGLRADQKVAITCKIAPGFYPTAAHFSIADFKAYDSNGSLIPGATGDLGVQMAY